MGAAVSITPDLLILADVFYMTLSTSVRHSGCVNMRSLRQSVVPMQRKLRVLFFSLFFSATVCEPGFGYMWSRCCRVALVGAYNNVRVIFPLVLPSSASSHAWHRTGSCKNDFNGCTATALFSLSGQGLDWGTHSDSQGLWDCS